MCTGEEARSGAGAGARTRCAGVTVAGAGGTEGEKSRAGLGSAETSIGSDTGACTGVSRCLGAGVCIVKTMQTVRAIDFDMWMWCGGFSENLGH